MQLQTTKVIDATRDLLKAFGYFVDNLWHIDDVHFICEQQELPKFTDAEAMEIFVIAGEQFDGETGISWPQLEQSVQIYLKRRATLQGMCEPHAA